MRRIIITLQGKVQGVGFRPFVYRLAVQYNLQGHTRNTSNGVNIDVQGDDADIDSFLADLINKKPGPAAVSQLSITEASQVFYPPADDDGSGRPFRIKESDSSGDAELALLPDTAICQRCLEELFEPLNRRYRYPFLHCVSCGPRFSLFSRMPFDRLNTSMADFPMCRECEREYGNPFDRRFHSQTNCCSGCGPYLTFLDSTGRQLAGKDGALEMAATELKRGAIVALKNTGGYMLLADAANEQTVAKLRIRKRRRQKPFALLVPTIRHAEELVEICAAAKEVLDSPAAPIVLLKKAKGAALVGRNVAPENPYHGIMLPHTGLQHLLTRAFRGPLVATSGNTSDLPICIDDDDALNKLSGVADFFLSHNRQIIHRLDDSIVHIINGRPVVLRKARGYIPCALELQMNALLSPKAVFAAGGQTKNAFAFAKGQMIYSSQHVGDLNSAETCQIYEQDVKKWKTLLTASPDLYVIDEHRGYFSSHFQGSVFAGKLPSC